MPAIQRITPCLWFDDRAEEAVAFYTAVFRNSRVVGTSHYGEEGREIHGKPPGSVLMVEFELDGQAFTALNGGPIYKFTEAISLSVDCKSQGEVDELWEKLIADGGQPSQCGWLKDKYGLSWQIVPSELPSLLAGPDRAGAARAMQAMLKMQKLDIATLEEAYDGKAD